ncbi:metallophosphoesterase [Bosea thiooxidans]|nr:metallophosphoesterase [Bosea sp. (in: a-proteobacteria)]
MRLLVMSDLHLELSSFHFPDDIPEFDVAVFAGDIGCPLPATVEWIERKRRGPLRGRPVVFVAGNHEFYGTEIYGALSAGRDRAQRYGIHMLSPGAVELAGVRFVGSTLWTNYQLHQNPHSAQRAALREMNDHRRIKIGEGEQCRLFKPEDAAEFHQRDLSEMVRLLTEPFDGPTVVVSHHAPHPNSVQPIYGNDPLAPAFASDLTEVIERFQPDLWIHGHDHGSHDYFVGKTRILTNQAGYFLHGGVRENPHFDPRLIVQVGPN